MGESTDPSGLPLAAVLLGTPLEVADQRKS